MDTTTANAHETDQLQGDSRVVNKKDRQTWGQFFYNPKTGKVMNRSIGSWFQLLLFYVVFYALLAAFWAVMLAVFLQTLDDKYPKWYGHQSVMATDHGDGWGPGVNYQPQPSSDSTLIALDPLAPAAGRTKRQAIHDTKPVTQGATNGPQPTSKFVQKMSETFKKYQTSDPNQVDCADGSQKLPGKACRFNTSAILELCSDENGFGYDTNQPCVVLALNKIYDWEPKPYVIGANSSADGQTPAELDRYLRRNGLVYNPERVYFICDGEDPVDQENIGIVRMIPPDGINAKYFPYQNQKGYLPPLAAAQFDNVRPNTVVNVLCRAFARNINFSADDRLGATKFEILKRA